MAAPYLPAVAASMDEARWRTDGKFFRSGGRRVWLKAATYGPFPGGMPESFDTDFARMAAAGFNALRLYEMPDVALLDAAGSHGLKVFGGLAWGQTFDFMHRPELLSTAKVTLANALSASGGHPALAAVFIGNEIATDLTRWMGPVKVRQALEELIAQGKALAPRLMFAYANYPSTEYLEPENADFTAFNVYLEDETAFRDYLQRLHHIAGDRPLVISEFGLDSSRNGLQRQAEAIRWGAQAAIDLETAGMTIFAWSDRWSNGGMEVLDWDFGLNDREGRAKPALAAAAELQFPCPEPEPLVSVIVCTRDGEDRIAACLAAIVKMRGGGFEIIVVDDGSTDGTAGIVARNFPAARLLRLAPVGLSAARNAGAQAARGEILAFTDDDCEPDEEWISRLRPIFKDGKFAAAGGPNLPPKARGWEEAVIAAAPGAPSHVMLDDVEAEHLPGCNFAVTKAALLAVGGYDPQFQTAGDDVDICWRLRDAGLRLGFVPGAFVWHRRRPTLTGFLRQQLGYGRAEKLLMTKHPSRFNKDGNAKWDGFVYAGGPVRVMEGSAIHYGPMGSAGYQAIINRMLPLRGLDPEFNTFQARHALALVKFLQPRLRASARIHRFWIRTRRPPAARRADYAEEFRFHRTDGRDRSHYLKVLLATSWKPCGETSKWDVEKYGTKILLATERGPGRETTVLVRVHGNPALLPFKPAHPARRTAGS